MMTQAYPEASGGGRYHDAYHRQQPAPLIMSSDNHRSINNHYYDRTPYAYYPPAHYPRSSNRSEYPGRRSTRAVIHDLEAQAGPGGQPRKRIGVACTRCRKRKIKCSGDVGDGTGCSACKAQGGDTMPCTFNRVGSDLIPQYEEYLASSQLPVSSQDVTYDLEPITSTMQGPISYHSISHRQSLPTLQTRGSFTESYDSYSASPVNGYAYSSYSVPRNDSVSNASYDNGFRTWSNAPTMPQASTYETTSGYTFGSISGPSLPGHQQQASSRLPSVTSESFSSLNMGGMYTSLPTQTVQSRRLPIPPIAPSYDAPQYAGPELPEIRPLAEPRTRLSSVYNRIGAPWANEGDYPESSRNSSSVSLAPPQSLGLGLQPIHSTSGMMQEPMTSYHYGSSSNETTIPTTQDTIASPTARNSTTSADFVSSPTNVAPTYSMPMTPVSYSSYYGLPPITTTTRSHHSSSDPTDIRQNNYRNADAFPPTTSSTSYNYTTNPSSDTSASTTTGSEHTGSSDDAGSATVPPTYSTAATLPTTYASVSGPGSGSYASHSSIRHPQPHHASSAEALRRQASFDQAAGHQQQQGQRSMGPTPRISVSDLSGVGPSSYSSA